MFFAKQYGLAVEYRRNWFQEKYPYSMCPRGVVNGRGLEKACKSVPPYHTGSLVLHKKGNDCTTAVAFLFIWDSLFDFSCFYDEFYAAGAAGGEAGEGLVVLAGLLDGFQAAHYIAQAAAKVV